MRNILRDPGAEVLVGLASFAVSFVGIGLALIALERIGLSYIAFGVAGLLLLVAGYSFKTLLQHYSQTQRYISQIGEYLSQGRKLRGALLSVDTISKWTEELQVKVPRWEAEVQRWLDDNLPDYAPQFDLESSITTVSTGRAISQAGGVIEHLESRMSNLKEILHDIRM
jgi:hypothetical protein